MTQLTRRAFIAGAAALPVATVVAQAEPLLPMPPSVQPMVNLLLPPGYAEALAEQMAMPALYGWAPAGHALIPITRVGYTNAHGEWIDL